MKRQTKLKMMCLLLSRTMLLTLLLSACSSINASATLHSNGQTAFSVNQNLGNDAPTSFINIDWSQTNKITIRGLGFERYPAFIGELNTGNVFPLYMDESLVIGAMPVVSADGNYLAFQTGHKLYLVSMMQVVLDGYLITPKSVISVFDQRSRCGLAWSPDSLQLASICLVLDGIKISLYTPGADKPQDIFQYLEENIDEIEGVSWSPDAAVLAISLRYRYDEEKNKTSQKDIFLYRIDTRTLLRLTNSPDDEQYPDWYPNDDAILTFTFTAEDAAESLDSRLIFSTEDGNCLKQVPNLKGIVSPTWSPEGSQMAYIADWMEIKILETSQFVPSNFLSQEGLCRVQ